MVTVKSIKDLDKLFLDGQEITDTDILAEIKSFIPKPTESKKTG